MGPKRTPEAERHVNIGSQFQAELPDLQDPARLEEEEEGAWLVWRPWGDIETNPEMQEKVTNLLNFTSPNAGLGGRVNPELALHCLHEAQGDVLEAAEMLRAGPPRRPESHPLADYHYTGSDTWTPVEEQLFKEAFSIHKKNFRLIQKQIQTKSVSQCVEYYYTWKKKMRFGCTRPRLMQKKHPRCPEEEEKAEDEALCSTKKRRRIVPMGIAKPGSREEKPHNNGSSAINPGASWCWDSGAGDLGFFPCGECGRVFEKIQGRNAHMRLHRPKEVPKAP